MKKEWIKSKGMWAGIALILKGIFYDWIYVGDPAGAANSFLLGLGILGIRDALD